MKEDLRVQKTRHNIHTALLTLLQEKDLQHIKVAEICKEAMCSRNTFYTYYYNKYELFQEICSNVVSQVCQTFSYDNFDFAASMKYGFGQNIIYAADKNRADLTALLKSDSGNELQRDLREELYRLELDGASRFFHWDQVPGEFVLAMKYQIGGVVNFLISWLRDYPDIPVEEAAALHAEENTQISLWVLKKFGNG